MHDFWHKSGDFYSFQLLLLQACTYSKLIKEPEEDVEFMFDYEFIDDAFNFSRRELWKSLFFQKRKKKNLFFYTYNTLVDEDDNIITSEDEYHWNSRILMENHPLMIMVDEGRLVKNYYILLC